MGSYWEPSPLPDGSSPSSPVLASQQSRHSHSPPSPAGHCFRHQSLLILKPLFLHSFCTHEGFPPPASASRHTFLRQLLNACRAFIRITWITSSVSWPTLSCWISHFWRVSVIFHQLVLRRFASWASVSKAPESSPVSLVFIIIIHLTFPPACKPKTCLIKQIHSHYFPHFSIIPCFYNRLLLSLSHTDTGFCILIHIFH